MTAYYNEIDPKAAAWLRELIKEKLIANGEVDERSIVDIRPSEIRGYTQCHFFAGIGIWSYALRLAGWPDDRPVWTGSCPCQPFSTAGKGNGFTDERHLWPAFHFLIEQRRPGTVFGEQVASRDGLAWLDLVHSDMEATDYSFGAFDMCAAGFGAPHIRQRLYFGAKRIMDNATGERFQVRTGTALSGKETFPINKRPDNTSGLADTSCQQTDTADAGGLHAELISNCRNGNMADTDNTRLEGRQGMSECADKFIAGQGGLVSRMGNAECIGRQQFEDGAGSGVKRMEQRGRQSVFTSKTSSGADWHDNRASQINGFWRNADWLFCRDGKWRPVKSGLKPLVNGTASRMVQGCDNGTPFDTEETPEARVMRLKGYGNAIVATQAAEFIKAYLSHCKINPAW